MLRDEAVSILKRGLGFLQSTEHDANIVAALKQAQELREGGRSLPWFLLQEDETFALVAGQREYSLPEGFIKLDVDFNDVILVGSNGALSPVEEVPYDEAMRLYDLGFSHTPYGYAIRNDTIHVFPLPEDGFSIRWTYFKNADLLDSNIENSWLREAPYVLISDAGLKMAKDLRDLEAAKIYQGEKAQWDDWFTREMTARRESNTRYVVGKYA